RNVGLGNRFVLSVAIHPLSPDTIYAGTGAGHVFKSTDAGATWNDTGLSAAFAVVALAIDPQTPTILYPGTFGDGAFKSTNAGVSWSRINSGLFNQGSDRFITIFSLAIDPQQPSTVYAGSFDNGVFKSTNGGESWVLNDVGLPANSVVHALAINSAGSCLHAGTGGGVYDFATAVDNACPPPPLLLSAVLPTSRSVQTGVPATAFAT